MKNLFELLNRWAKKYYYIMIGLVSLAFFGVLPSTGDDWSWGSYIGMRRLERWFAGYNGRYAGNLLVLFMTRSHVLRTIFMTLVTVGIVYCLTFCGKSDTVSAGHVFSGNRLLCGTQKAVVSLRGLSSGSIAGTALMFSNSGYGNIAAGDDYRSFGSEGGLLYRMISNIVTHFSESFLLGSVIVNGCIVICMCLIARELLKQDSYVKYRRAFCTANLLAAVCRCGRCFRINY